MKRFDTFYYFFIIGGMVLSTHQAPAMFIEHNALAGWLWVLVFIGFLLLLFVGELSKISTTEGAQSQSLHEIIGWVCIIGQWMVIILLNDLFLVGVLTAMVFISIASGRKWEKAQSNKSEKAPQAQIAGTPVSKRRRKHFRRQY